MLTHNPSELNSQSKFLTRLQQGRAELNRQLDQMVVAVEQSLAMSDEGAHQLIAAHREYEKITSELAAKRTSLEAEAKSSRDANDALKMGAAIGAGALTWHAAVLVTIFTGGAGFPALIAAAAATAAAAGGASEAITDNTSDVAAWKESELRRIQGEYAAPISMKEVALRDAKTANATFLEKLKTAEQRKLYFGVVSKMLLDNGINIAHQLEQFAQFNGIGVDAMMMVEDTELKNILERIMTGRPKATDVDRLLAVSNTMAGKPVFTPEARTLKQFVNHVLIPNKLYFDILSSYADDIRQHPDLSTFPPLEILHHKPLTFSGRVPAPAETAEQLAARKEKESIQASAKQEIHMRVTSNAVYEIFKESTLPQTEKMLALANANEDEIAQYAGIFSDLEDAMAALSARQADLTDQRHSKHTRIQDGTRNNAVLDGRITEIRKRNDAKQVAAKKGSWLRGGLALGGGAVLALIATTDGGVASAPLASKLLSWGFAEKVGKNALNSLVHAGGQGYATSVENSMLDDYMQSLALQKADLPALQKELNDVDAAIEKTQRSVAFQALLKDEAKRSHIAETLLLRSLIRNGYNNSDDIDVVCKAMGVGSVDVFLDHYKGTRLGLALKKHCHGLADSNDLGIIMADSDCLRGAPTGADKVLQTYVEETVKPNIASYRSKANKMDVISQNNLTGFGHELHFAAEMQLETNRAVRLLTANEYGMSVVGRQDVRSMFDYWLHRHGDRYLYDDKIRDGEIGDHEYPEKRVSLVSHEKMNRFVDMAKRSVASGRTSFPKVGDPFLRFCAHEYFLPQAIHVGGKDNIFTDYPESPSAYPMANAVIGEFVRKLSFADINDYRGKIGERLDNVIASAFLDFFAKLGELHQQDPELRNLRQRLKIAANYDDYAPLFDRYAKSITRDALGQFDLFLDIYKRDLEKHFEGATREDRQTLDDQLAKVKDLADGKLNPPIIRPGTYEARLQAYDESHTGENMLRRG